MTMSGLASVGAGVLDELGIESAHVLGTSFGGAVAQQMAFSIRAGCAAWCWSPPPRRLLLAR